MFRIHWLVLSNIQRRNAAPKFDWRWDNLHPTQWRRAHHATQPTSHFAKLRPCEANAYHRVYLPGRFASGATFLAAVRPTPIGSTSTLVTSLTPSASSTMLASSTVISFY